MDESVYAGPVGRRPMLRDGGERLEKYAVKLYPSQWKELGTRGAGERSSFIRDLIDRALNDADSQQMEPSTLRPRKG